MVGQPKDPRQKKWIEHVPGGKGSPRTKVINPFAKAADIATARAMHVLNSPRPKRPPEEKQNEAVDAWYKEYRRRAPTLDSGEYAPNFTQPKKKGET